MKIFDQKSDSRDRILHHLATAYDDYEFVHWVSREVGGEGRSLVEFCLKSAENLRMIASVIGRGLHHGNEDANKASLLFARLYKKGVDDFALIKDIMRERFQEILPEESIKRLDSEEDITVLINAHMKAFYEIEETKKIAKVVNMQ